MSLTRMAILASLLLEWSPFVLFEIDLVSALLLEYPLEYFDGTYSAFFTIGIISLCYIWHGLCFDFLSAL